jgi:hypothetical protein
MSAPTVATQPAYQRSSSNRPPAPMEVFRPILLRDVPIPQLAIDTVAAQIALAPKDFAEGYLSLLYVVKRMEEREDQRRRAHEESMQLHPTLAVRMEQRLTALEKRAARSEDRLDGQQYQKSIENLRQSVEGLIARENV